MRLTEMALRTALLLRTAPLPQKAPHPKGSDQHMTKPDNYDVVIGGSGLAGSAAAILLARRGVRVALLERRRTPRRTRCCAPTPSPPTPTRCWTNLALSPLWRRREPSATRRAGTPVGDGSSRGPRRRAPSCRTRTTSGAASSTR
ncbi:NAD(P)-binding protein [Streptomyces sp. MS1.HAVA.3]|uniref:NAD(P)-binding protein n=1 Tax=Streptomyces caledonius TaxID=3134107 RepID=A0ABU8U1F6_9ACTN